MNTVFGTYLSYSSPLIVVHKMDATELNNARQHHFPGVSGMYSYCIVTGIPKRGVTKSTTTRYQQTFQHRTFHWINHCTSTRINYIAYIHDSQVLLVC